MNRLLVPFRFPFPPATLSHIIGSPAFLADRTMSSVPPSLADVVRAFVSATPGLLYQFARAADGAVRFPYLSEGCQALLGIAPGDLQDHPERFLELILEADRPSYLASMDMSAQALTMWNWEGRIWIAEWNDEKWINLRCMPRPDGEGGTLWEGIMTNITASKQAQNELVRSRARLAELTAHMEQVKEQERSRIARELHDDVGGNLTAIKMALAMLMNRLPGEPPQLAEKAAYVDTLVDRTIDAIHRISLDLRPAMLDLGLVAALEWQCGEFERHYSLPCRFTCTDGEPPLNLDQATALFRIAQEALTNVAKHAQASHAAVQLEVREGLLTLAVSDDGKGLAAADRQKAGSFGLRGMSERAEALGGKLALSPAPGGGTIVAIQLRLPEGGAAPSRSRSNNNDR
jgi:signal transduction histidine kinase